MTILNEGINKVRDYLVVNVSEGDWGTGTAQALPSDSGLVSEISGVEVSTTNSSNDKVATIVAVLPSTSGGTAVVTEHVTRFSDGTEFNRVKFTGITKSSTKEIHNITTTVLFNGNS